MALHSALEKGCKGRCNFCFLSFITFFFRTTLGPLWRVKVLLFVQMHLCHGFRFPLTADVSKLTKHLKEKVTDGKDKLEKEPGNQQAWRDLAEVTLASLIVFNRERAGEVSKIKSADLPKLKKGSNGMNFGLSKLEEQLCKILWKIEIVGKKDRTGFEGHLKC